MDPLALYPTKLVGLSVHTECSVYCNDLVLLLYYTLLAVVAVERPANRNRSGSGKRTRRSRTSRRVVGVSNLVV